MSSGSGRLWVWIILAVMVFGSAAAVAEGPRGDRAEVRLNQWVSSFARFAERHPDLTPEQMTIIWSAVEMATPETFAMGKGAKRWAAEEGTQVLALVKRAQQLFSREELGELFTGMGSLQLELAQVAATPAYCNCSNIGGTCPSYPKPNSCKTGCLSWTDDAGNNWVGICTPTAVETDPVPR